MAPESAAEEEARLQHEHLREDVLKPQAGGLPLVRDI